MCLLFSTLASTIVYRSSNGALKLIHHVTLHAFSHELVTKRPPVIRHFSICYSGDLPNHLRLTYRPGHRRLCEVRQSVRGRRKSLIPGGFLDLTPARVFAWPVSAANERTVDCSINPSPNSCLSTCSASCNIFFLPPHCSRRLQLNPAFLP